MMTIKQFSFFSLFLCLLIVGCSKNNNSYFPLDKGYKWQYDVALITRDGLSNQKYIYNNLGEGELNGEPVYLRESLDGSILYYSNSNDGIHYLGSMDSQSLNPEFHEDKQLIIPAVLSLDTEWQHTTYTRLLQKTGPPQKTVFKIIAEIPLEIKIESFDETVDVPAGRFNNCMKVSMSGFVFKNAGNYIGLTMVSVEQTNWYAPGVGLVKMERLETTQRKALDKGTLLIELAKFESG
jgi:uncharacterized protein DUF3108